MGAGARLRDLRPPLPAPTESQLDGASGFDTDADAATTVTTRTDKTSYELPEDGSPITIATHRPSSRKEGNTLSSSHGRQKSQTSLLIEYFEGGKVGDKTRTRPSVRVKVTPSSRKRSSGPTENDAVQITGIGKDRKPSYTRRISLGGARGAESVPVETGTNLSHSSDSNPPLEIEVLHHNESDVSSASRGLMYAPIESTISSMPPDSLLEQPESGQEQNRGFDRDEETLVPKDYLKAPLVPRDRSNSRDRITQKVLEKLGQTGTKSRKLSKQRSEGAYSYDQDDGAYERAWKSAKERQFDDEPGSGAEGSLLSTDPRSLRSGSELSRASKASNNPKLLQMVEDAIKRDILPGIEAIKVEQRKGKASRGYDSGLERRVSKSSSSPNITSKPKVVLNREGDDPGTLLSRGDSERQKRRTSQGDRPSSRKSSGKFTERIDEDEIEDFKTSQSSSRKLHDLEHGAAGGILTAAALKQHDSHDEVRRRRKKRSKSRSSRSKSAGLDEEFEERNEAQNVPPMPVVGHVNDSEVTRESIMSADTERPRSPSSIEHHTPIREVSRGSIAGSRSPAASTTRLHRNLGMSHDNRSLDSSPTVGGVSFSGAKMAALAAGGIGGAALAKAAYERHVDADGYGDPPVQRRLASPAQSVSSLKRNFEDHSLVPADLRPRSAASRSSAGRLHEREMSQSSIRSGDAGSPRSNLHQSRNASRDLNEDFITPMEHMPDDERIARDGTATPGTPGTPSRGESVGDWYARQHQLNDQYRDSLNKEDETRCESMATTNFRDSYQTNPFPQDGANYRDSYQTNPYPQDEKRFAPLSDESSVQSGDRLDAEQGVGLLGANPRFIHTPHGAESAVASLMDPSNVSSNRLSDQSGNSPFKGASYRDRMATHLKELNKESPPMYDGSTVSQTMPSRDRWAAIRANARDISASSNEDIGRFHESPRQSPIKSLGDEAARPVTGSSSIPVANDPLPAIGHFNETKAAASPHQSIIHGPLGGDATGKSTWPYTPEPEPDEGAARDVVFAKDTENRGGMSKADELMLDAIGGAALANGVHEMMKNRPTVEDAPEEESRLLTPNTGRRPLNDVRDARQTFSPATSRDEGYVTDNHARSTGGLTPGVDRLDYSKQDIADYHKAMNQHDKDDDPFLSESKAKHTRNVSGNSHGMASPVYDSATGKGKDHIQSKDIVALMDHLTVRDAQRNAVDTEILVSLVRSAAEMRQSFDEMKRFIVEQDRLIMDHADRGVDQTVQRVLGGPRPQPASSRTQLRQSEEDIQTKRKGVLRRALRGLTGSKSASDLARVEDMLMQILDNVEDLKRQQQTTPRAGTPQGRELNSSQASQTFHQSQSGPYFSQPRSNDTLDSYEKLRNATDPGYEPEGRAGTSSTPSYSGQFSAPRNEKHQFHSGYDGRRGSEKRVSTVAEGDEEDSDLEPHEAQILSHQFENNERMLITPTPGNTRGFQADVMRSGGRTGGYNIPPVREITPRSADKQNLHKSVSPGAPKISRWSKTTASSVAQDLAAPDSPGVARNRHTMSEASSSTRSLHRYDEGRSQARSNRGVDQTDRGSFNSSRASRHTRTPSPLIPSETSTNRRVDEYEEEREGSPEQVDDDFDDPKYQAHRNSLLLQHPQPRQGQTDRHQTTLESQAYTFDATASRTASDVSQRSISDFDPAMWGSAGTAGLAKHRLSQVEPISPVSPIDGRGYGQDDGPLVPQKTPTKTRYEPEPEHEQDDIDQDWEPQYSNSGFSRGGYYSSPFGSGHLLEPIEEVRNSLETDSGHISPEIANEQSKSSGMRSAIRKITGPRPMTAGKSAPDPGSPASAVRRKPLAGGANKMRGGRSVESFDSEIF